MLNNETVRKLHEMRLSVMAEAFSAQLEDAQFQAVSFEDRFAILVDAEWSTRKSNRLTRLIRNAGYADPAACVENIEYLPERKLDREQILRLASCAYLQEAHMSSSWGQPGPERPTWPAPLAWRPAVVFTPCGTSACRICWWRSPWPGPTALTGIT